MAETLTIISERVDDMPVLLAQLDRLGVRSLLDEHVPTPGNWVGLSLGWVSVLWLTHILSGGDHRLNHVAAWATQRLHTLQECTGQPVHPLDVSDDRLANAQAAVTALHTRGRGRRRDTEPSALREAVDAILTHYRVHGLLHVRYTDQLWEHPVRRSGRRDTTVRLEWDGQVHVSINQEAVAAAVRQLGWRVYLTTQPPEQLSLQEAVLAYRNAYLVERAMGRLKGRPLSLTPMYLEREDHATGLIRLWSLGLRVLTLLEVGVRRRLATAKTALAGLYVGNPKRATPHPTAARLLEAFQGLTLTLIREGRRRRRHLTPLPRMQQRILALLDFPVAIYTRLCPDSHNPP